MSRAIWLLAGLSMRGALSWPTFVVAYLINLFVAAVGGFGASASWPQRLVAVTVATGAMFAVVLALRPAESRMRAGPSRGLLALAAFAVAGAVRGVVVASFFVAWGVDGGTGELPRIVGGIALGLAVLAPMSLLVGQAREFAVARARLLAQRQQLIAAVEHVATQIEDRDVRVIERLRVALMQALDAPVDGWSDDAGASADRLEAIARDVIRPLSHELAGAVPTVPIAESTASRGRIRWREILDEATRGHPLLPWATSALVALLSAPSLSTTVGAWWAIATIVIGMPILAALVMAANAAIHPLVSRSRLGLRSALVAAAAVGVGIIAGVVAQGIFVGMARTIDLSEARSPLIALALLVPGLAIPLSIARGATRARARVLGELMESDSALTRRLARLRQVQWSQQRMLARVLHGPMQTLVVSGAARLRTVGECDFDAQVFQLRRDLLGLLDMTSATGDRLSWDAGVRRIEATWQSVAAISVVASDAALATLDADPVATDVAVEIVAEAAGNAVRHGDASAITVDLTGVGEDLLIRVEDNGRGGLGAGSGLGSQVLQDCCLTWRRAAGPSGVILEALLPVSAGVVASGT